MENSSFECIPECARMGDKFIPIQATFPEFIILYENDAEICIRYFSIRIFLVRAMIYNR